MGDVTWPHFEFNHDLLVLKDLIVETTSNIKQTSLKALLRDKLLSHVSMLGGTVGDGADGLLHSLKKKAVAVPQFPLLLLLLLDVAGCFHTWHKK